TRLTGSAGIFSRACLIALGLSMGTAVLPAAAASPDNPGYFRDHMKPGSTLNVRKTPSLKAAKVGALTADTDKIVNHGCHIGMPYLEWRKSTTAIRKVETRRKWCNIEYNGMVGWTAGQYLQADAPE
uniref:SH3 domain-containing protein n=1 Tax=Sneathiella sp. TaxID=1964365 RepID=UPI003569E390